jgi:hypothetical protein
MQYNVLEKFKDNELTLNYIFKVLKTSFTLPGKKK